jgi:diacylglycerol kinase (ATP)
MLDSKSQTIENNFRRNKENSLYEHRINGYQRVVNMGAGNDNLIRHIINAFRYTWAGLVSAWKNELAFRGEVVVAIVMVPLGFWLGRSAVEQALLIASILLILLTELLNSALEAVVDRIGPQRHELSKRAKDMGSAAAFVSMVTAALVWIIIALDRFGN